MNPCRCGRASDLGFICKRGQNIHCAAEYQGRLSGPLVDRIDLHVEVPAVTAADLILRPPAEGSREVAARVARARDIQVERYATLDLSDVRTNAQVSGPVLEQVARADSAGMALLRDAADSMRLDITRSYGSRARSPISTEPSASDACISRKPCPIGRSPTTCAERRDLPHARYRIYLALTKAIETCDWTILMKTSDRGRDKVLDWQRPVPANRLQPAAAFPTLS